MTFGKKVIQFYKDLEVPKHLPKKVEVLYPFKSPKVIEAIRAFNTEYFDDEKERTFLIGINPGRYGGGITGIPFTDPIRLEHDLKIQNSFDKKPELSSNFIYQMIAALRGPKTFYEAFYFTSVSPLGFVMEGKNLNYYDIKELQEVIEPYIVANFKKQIAFGAKPVAYSLGMGKNIAYLNKLNEEHKLFEKIEPLPHPRWIMQYRLKRLNEFIELYKSSLTH
jgi:hypothetical protein